MVASLNKNAVCSNYAHPHAVVINCMCAFFSECFRGGIILHEKLDEQATSLLNLNRFWPKFSKMNEYDEGNYIFGYWDKGFLDPAEEEFPSNGILEFNKGERYLTYITSTEWSYWQDKTPYDFPAVFYSPAELHAWFVWAFKNFIRSLPNHKDRLIEIMECLWMLKMH